MSYRPITDMWVLARPKLKRLHGRKVKYYGTYPPGFLERARALMGVHIDDAVLHVCSGMIRLYPYPKRTIGINDKTLDLDPKVKPDFCQDAREPFPMRQDKHLEFEFSKYWDAVLMDPPYTESDAEHYRVGSSVLPSPRKLIQNALEVVKPFGRVGLLHYLSPSVKGAKLIAWAGVVVGHNNRIRLFSVYEKEAPCSAKKRKKKK